MPILRLSELQALQCTGCEEVIEIRREKLHAPEELLEFIELVELDHAECDRFHDVWKAKQARKFRKKKLKLRGPGVGQYATESPIG